MHWKYISRGRYGIVPDLFERTALSFEIGALKPDREIYTAAAEMAGVDPEEIFYTDDCPANVEGAQAVGFDAVPFTTVAALAAELRQRDVTFLY
jgi:FMN phosphatase YigB (HAD superfamily)